MSKTKKSSAKDIIRNPNLKSFSVLEKTENFYTIPYYQRSYEWGKDRVEDFWNDLIVPENKSSYNLSFTGSVILKNDKKDDDDHYEIIDGQQRFITVSIFTAVMRDYLEKIIQEKYSKSKYQEINLKANKTLNALKNMLRKETRTTDQPRLIAGKIIRDCYEKYIANSSGYENTNKIVLNRLNNDSERNIIRNYRIFSRLLETYIEKNIGLPKRNEFEHQFINDFIDLLADLYYIEIVVTDDVAAYEIFETVNSKNEELTSSDLIKNLIFMTLKNEGKSVVEECEKSWNNAIANVSTISGINFKSFIRYYWVSAFSWSTDKKLYANFKSYILDSKNFIDDEDRVNFLKNFVSELEYNSKLLKILVNAQDVDGIINRFSNSKRDNKKIIKSLKSLQIFNVKQCYVLLLSILRNSLKTQDLFQEKDGFSRVSSSVSDIFKQIEVFTLKFSTLGKGQANKVESDVYSEIAIFIENDLVKHQKWSDQYLTNPKGKNSKGFDRKLTEAWTNILKSKVVSSLNEVLEDESISQKEFFISSIKRLRYDKDYNIINYVLEKINQYSYGQKEMDFNELLTQEHILPQKPKKWGMTEKEVSDYVNSIGNIIILEKEHNENLGNETLFSKLDGVKVKDILYKYEDNKISHNKSLFKKIKKNIPDKDTNAEWSRITWNKDSINSRSEEIAKDFYLSLEKYLN